MNICVGCGLCCDGTLFAQAELRPDDDVATLSAVQIRIASQGASTCLIQPCSASVDGHCEVYDLRPHVCREYRCRLKADVDAGSVAAQDALQLIQTACELRDRLRSGLATIVPASHPMSLDQHCSLALDALPKSPGSETPQHRSLLLDIGALSILLTRHFRTRYSADVGGEALTRMA